MDGVITYQKEHKIKTQERDRVKNNMLDLDLGPWGKKEWEIESHPLRLQAADLNSHTFGVCHGEV